LRADYYQDRFGESIKNPRLIQIFAAASWRDRGPVSYARLAMNFQATAAADHRLQIFPWPALFIAGIWFWAIWSSAEHWQGNPNYSYGWAVPVLAIGFALRRYLRMSRAEPESASPQESMSIWRQVPFALSFGALVFLLEYSREQMWHPMIVLWAICLLAVISTIVLTYLRGSSVLARSELFPVLFFLTAVPWPPRFEQPIVSALMGWVAATVTELLHWFGIEAQTSGAAIALRSGLVGISEACSGVRSMQAGIMFGLAMGEWFLLRSARRVALLLLAVVLALATNLARTLALALQAEWHGLDSLDRVHDFIGNVAITALILGIWIAGKLLAPRLARRLSLSIQEIAGRARYVLHRMVTPASSIFCVLALSFVAGILCARGLYAKLEAEDQTQTSPFFVAKIDNSNQLLHLPREIWNELRPTKAEFIRHQSAELPGGSADCFHFFWKPSAWNRFVLVHRPDICMPGIGWAQVAAPEPLDVTIGGRTIRCHLFRFRRGNFYALELWGVWRNGEPVPLEYQAAQVFGATIPPASLHLEGKRRSATEIVACAVISNGTSPADEIAVALLRSVFQYK
jgi:exosortase